MLLMTAEQRADLAHLLQRLLLAYRSQLFNPPYNLVFQTAPMRWNEPGLTMHPDELCGSYHWHIQLMPHLEAAAGIEAGTGLYVNPVAPEDAATALRPPTS